MGEIFHCIKFFYSKSKDLDDLELNIPDWRKRLSNFWVYDEKGRFPSIEHEFQFQKYKYSTNPKEGDKILWETLTPAQAKSMGTKTEFKKRRIQLDVEKYNKDRLNNMINLVLKRYKKDAIYRKIINSLTEKKFR